MHQETKEESHRPGGSEMELSVLEGNIGDSQTAQHPKKPEGTWMTWTWKRMVNGRGHTGKWISRGYKQVVPRYGQPYGIPRNQFLLLNNIILVYIC